MQISVLAVKCRFCGEEVGKPKEELRTLSINDLGGEVIHHRAPSGSVIEAMEAFRVETGLEEAADSPDDPATHVAAPAMDADGMPILDQDTYGTYSSSSSSITSVREVKPVTLASRVKTIGLVLAVLLVLIVLGVQAPGWISQLRESEAEAIEPTFVNRAPRIIARGGSPIEALTAAMEAIDYEDSAPNKKIAEDALAGVLEEIQGLLNASPFSNEKLNEASKLTAHAAELYPNERTREQIEEVRAETTAYKIILIGIDSSTGTATFRKSGSDPFYVKQGEMLLDRFYVRSIGGTSSVTLEDRIRRNRIIIHKIGTGPL